MADPRFKNGAHKSLSRPEPADLDSPTNHGWQRAGQSETTGYTLYTLQGAKLRCTTPEERAATGDDYLIAIGDRTYTAPGGDLARITAEVKQVLCEEKVDLDQCFLCDRLAELIAGDWELCRICYNAISTPVLGLDDASEYPEGCESALDLVAAAEAVRAEFAAAKQEFAAQVKQEVAS